uniref:NADH dehydrogenase subunit 6 n=1 Tax=Grandidierella rubroantennata TaxID=2614733 RepID=A0A5H2XYT9_9CRUS|nr:NADH dehydrogenase subunit 6 [Grandidierella rubroantennata]
MYFVSQLILFVFFIFIFSEHLLVMNFSLMLTSMFYSFILYHQMLTTWMAYILMMVFLSGMMVIFIYMTSLSSNEPFNFSPYMMIIMVFFNLLFPFFIFKKNFLLMENSNLLLNTNFPFSLEMVYKTYSVTSWELTLCLIIYLFVTLIVSVKISSMKSGPLKKAVN